MWILGLDSGSREKIKLLKITVLGKLAKCAPGLYIGKQYSIDIKFLNLVTNLRLFKESVPGFPGGAVVENLPANAGDTGSSPGLGRSHMPRSN